ncbi:MAG: cytochrome c [Actinomycetota bacterium]|nr:cytochrome c [Actinomycetota bacterium]
MTSTSDWARARARRSRLQRLSNYVVVLLALTLVGALYTAFAAPNGRADDGGQQSIAVKEGRALYLTGCSTCHGLNLEGGSGGPSLVGVGQAAVVFQVESGRMPLVAGVAQAPRKKLRYSLAEIDQLAAFVQANGGGPTIPSGNLSDGDLVQGGTLFRTNCASCHNFAGAGGALTHGKYAPALKSSSARVIQAAMLTGPENMPRFTDQQLSPQQKAAITRYVQYITHAPDPGGSKLGHFGPIPEGLVVFLVGIGGLVGITLWIGARA